MDIKTLYKKYFPIGGVDDNNRYVDLPGDKINSVQLLEPVIGVKKFILTNKDLQTIGSDIAYKYAYRIPLISIDDYLINQIDLCAFKLDYTGFLPTIVFEFIDSGNKLLSTSIPKDGSIISVYIGGNGDELYYKPIRQDFVLTNIKKVSKGVQNDGDIFKYRVYGKLNVPYGYRRESWSVGKCTSIQALFNLAVLTGLGFSTNFTKETVDTMKWQNSETGTFFDFMEDIAAHACYSPNTFFTSFIDQYNVLNFVECHSLLSHGGSKSDVPAMIYMSYPPYKLPVKEGQSSETKNNLPLKSGDDENSNNFQQLSYYFLSNNEKFNGWTNYIEDYQEISNSGSSLSDGFKAHVRYNSKMGNLLDFTIRPIDNLKRDTATQRIESLPLEPTYTSYIPLNLMQMTNSQYLNNQSTVDNMTNVESFHNFGNEFNSNTFGQYRFAEVQNSYQLRCMKKCGLKVRLQNYNPSITKFSRVWVDIYDKNSVSPVTKTPIYNNDSGEYRKYKMEINDNILQFDEDNADPDTDGVYNRALSGWYVVTEMDISYNPDDNNLNMNLMLNRIEYRPLYKNEYTQAKNAIDKYKNENIIENILTKV